MSKISPLNNEFPVLPITKTTEGFCSKSKGVVVFDIFSVALLFSSND